MLTIRYSASPQETNIRISYKLPEAEVVSFLNQNHKSFSAFTLIVNYGGIIPIILYTRVMAADKALSPTRVPSIVDSYSVGINTVTYLCIT